MFQHCRLIPPRLFCYEKAPYKENRCKEREGKITKRKLSYKCVLIAIHDALIAWPTSLNSYFSSLPPPPYSYTHPSSCLNFMKINFVLHYLGLHSQCLLLNDDEWVAIYNQRPECVLCCALSNCLDLKALNYFCCNLLAESQVLHMPQELLGLCEKRKMTR